eukprot:m.161636 g.161636  ORF g.161636 m.161636 type:complete len:189 (-) comp9867_c0_seq7:92-658(-)
MRELMCDMSDEMAVALYILYEDVGARAHGYGISSVLFSPFSLNSRQILLRINGSVTQTAAVSLNQQRGLNLAARDALAMSHALQSDDDASEDECAPPPQWQPDVPVDDDYISLLNLWWQQVYRPAGFGSRGFRYYSARVGGPDQAPIWLALACLDDNNYFLGRTARSKKIAEQSAAREAYTQIVRERY